MSVFPDVNLTELPKTFEAEVSENHLDMMGHMNVTWYTHFFSEGMLGLYTLMGLSADDVEERQYGSFALETHTRYFREIRVGHQVAVYCRIVARNEKRFHVMSFLWNKSCEEISASYEIVGMSIDLRERRPAPIPEDLAIEIDKLIAAHKQLDWDPPVCGVMGPR